MESSLLWMTGKASPFLRVVRYDTHQYDNDSNRNKYNILQKDF